MILVLRLSTHLERCIIMLNLAKLSVRCMQTSSKLICAARYSTARPTVIVRVPSETDLRPEKQQTFERVKDLKNTGLVAAAFASLQEQDVPKPVQKPNFIDRRIARASSVDELLSICDDIILSRPYALKIVSVLAQWSTSGRVALNDFETDPRFLKMCRILSRGSNKNRVASRNSLRDDDLSMVLGVTGDDEAAKLVESITLPQMIKVMSTLALKKRRSTPLLRSLAYNISRNAAKLDLKQCADLLYSMTILNFPESLLLERISNDAIEGLETNTNRTAVIGSLLTSIGLLRFKDPDILDALCEWMLKYHSICRPQDVAALLQTLAVVNHQPSNGDQLYQVLIPQLNIADVPKPIGWLDIVWSLVLLNKATNEHISSVLNQNFIDTLTTDTVSISSTIKLLNIDAAATYLMQDYSGPRLEPTSTLRQITITRTKEKQMMVASMLDTLRSLFSSNTYLKSDFNSEMGFLIDGECVIDQKCNPVPIAKTESSSEYIRIAILAYDYHDMCRGLNLPHGSNVFIQRILEAKGYRLIIVPYTDFNPRDKLIQRVQYLEKQIKAIAASYTK